MAQKSLPQVGALQPLRAATDLLLSNRKTVVVGLLVVASALNLADLASTVYALSNGFVETYQTSVMLMGTTGLLGFSVAKVAFSGLLLWNARIFVNRLDRLGKKGSLVFLILCFVMFAMYTLPVANNISVLLQN